MDRASGWVESMMVEVELELLGEIQGRCFYGSLIFRLVGLIS